MVHIRFDGGTLAVDGLPDGVEAPGCEADRRTKGHRAFAMHHAGLVRWLVERGIPFEDAVRKPPTWTRVWTPAGTARTYQREAVAAWKNAGRRGLIVLPTGTGKSMVAEMAIDEVRLPTLVVAPTLDLCAQWYDRLQRAFGPNVGVVGGGRHEVTDLTVTTYDSAWMTVDRLGDRFGLLVFDEVHHLPGPSFGQAAEGSLAACRLGLTATPERPDGAHVRLDVLVGPIVYRREIPELEGEWLAPYRTETLQVHLGPAEREAYDDARAQFRNWVDASGLRGAPWDRLIREAARSAEGRAAMRAWRVSRRILEGTEAKLEVIDELLRVHAGRRTILFTNDNATAFEVSRRFLVPALTHHADVAERRRWLSAFSDGSQPVLATSRVLNEGVDVPAAEVAIVVSGSGTVREHVQRLGRILRPLSGKQALLVELVVSNSHEEGTSERRRGHAAYQRD